MCMNSPHLPALSFICLLYWSVLFMWDPIRQGAFPIDRLIITVLGCSRESIVKRIPLRLGFKTPLQIITVCSWFITTETYESNFIASLLCAGHCTRHWYTVSTRKEGNWPQEPYTLVGRQTLNNKSSVINSLVTSAQSTSKMDRVFAAAAAAAKSLQLCLSLCDPIDGSPRGSAVPGILQGIWGVIKKGT